MEACHWLGVYDTVPECEPTLLVSSFDFSRSQPYDHASEADQPSIGGTLDMFRVFRCPAARTATLSQEV